MQPHLGVQVARDEHRRVEGVVGLGEAEQLAEEAAVPARRGGEKGRGRARREKGGSAAAGATSTHGLAARERKRARKRERAVGLHASPNPAVFGNSHGCSLGEHRPAPEHTKGCPDGAGRRGEG